MSNNPTRPGRVPELLAPAGNWDCVSAAIENGANAIYFGLDSGFNARHRAANFHVDDLPRLMGTLHTRGLRGYVTLNTLVFPDELPRFVEAVGYIARAGVDAVLVQDFGVARIVRAICPDLEIHASTQMSLTSAETIAAAADLGIARVVVARELSVREIRRIRDATDMSIEAFIHGALCVAYSGQCLTSESLGGRSANRGQCAQACRLPYELVCDGEDRDLGDVKYLLSPQDLAGYAAIPDMIAAGVDSLKIEGRLKTAEYVANITSHYRRAIDQAVSEGVVDLGDRARQEMELSFSRGFTPGWLEGNDHKRLVPGVRSAKQGIPLGDILDQRGDEIRLVLQADVRLGDGLAIACQTHASVGQPHQGGRIYSLRSATRSRSAGPEKRKDANAGQDVWVGFGRGEIDFSQIAPDAEVFKNDDPQLNRRLRQSFAGPPQRPRRVDFQVTAHAGHPLVISASVPGTDGKCERRSDESLATANKHPIAPEVLADKLGRLGGTPFELGGLTTDLAGDPMVPLGMLNEMRRNLVDDLTAYLHSPPAREVDVSRGYALVQPIVCDVTPNDGQKGVGPLFDRSADETPSPRMSVLCRTIEQLEMAVSCGVDQVIADFHDVRTHRQAVSIGRDAGVTVVLASLRIQKPGEMGLVKQLVRYQPDAILARNLAALDASVAAGIVTIADFSLNVANHRSAEWLIDRGAIRVTASYDLNADQLGGLIASMPPAWLEIVMHQHMPMFHMEHCVFCAVLSPGTNKTNCGRPCDRHVVQLRDRVGQLHVLQADIGCRNTLFNAQAQSGAEIVGSLIGSGVRQFRVELLDENPAQTRDTIGLYRRLLAGEVSGPEVWRRLSADNRVGVTRGTLEATRNPLAIL